MGHADERGNRARLGEVDVEHASAHPGFYRLVLNRRKNVVRVMLRDRDMPTVPLSNEGQSFLQVLEAGPVWALRGVRGSERDTQSWLVGARV